MLSMSEKRTPRAKAPALVETREKNECEEKDPVNWSSFFFFFFFFFLWYLYLCDTQNKARRASDVPKQKETPTAMLFYAYRVYIRPNLSSRLLCFQMYDRW